MMKQIPTLQECMDRFIKHGECEHLYKEKVEPFGCKVRIESCIVCKKEFGRVYL